MTTDLTKIRPLRDGEVMAVYMEFDRNSDKTWSTAEYLLQFGAAISNATVKANQNLKEDQDAARYCWLRHGDNDERASRVDELYNTYLLRGSMLDEVIDWYIIFDANEEANTVEYR